MNVYYVVMLFLVSLVQSITGALNVADFSVVTSVLVQPVTDTRKDATIKRLLRSVIEGGEERASGLPVSIVGKAKTIFTATDVTETTLKGWLDKGKSIDDVFLRMRLTQAGDKIFENPHFFTWLKYADDLSKTKPAKATSTVATLAKHYGDDVLLGILQAAVKDY